MISRCQELDRIFSQGTHAALSCKPQSACPYLDAEEVFTWQMGYQWGIAEICTQSGAVDERKAGRPGGDASADPTGRPRPNLVIL